MQFWLSALLISLLIGSIKSLMGSIKPWEIKNSEQLPRKYPSNVIIASIGECRSQLTPVLAQINRMTTSFSLSAPLFVYLIFNLITLS